MDKSTQARDRKALLLACGMIERMKSNPKASGEYTTFENALKTVLSVPRSEMLRREAEYKAQRAEQKKKRAKTSPAVRVSRDKD